jgi:hypothetical protein
MILVENSVGSVPIADTPVHGVIKLTNGSMNKNGSECGLGRVILSGKWLNKADIVRGSFII